MGTGRDVLAHGQGRPRDSVAGRPGGVRHGRPDNGHGRSFSGTSSVDAVSAALSAPDLTVSLDHPIGGIQLRTDPSPPTDAVTITRDVTVLGAAGLPAPTGFISVRIGGLFRHIIALTSGGAVTFQTNPTPGLSDASPIRVSYEGDPMYAAAERDFSVSDLSGSTGRPPAGGATGGAVNPPAVATGKGSAQSAGGAGSAGAAAPAGIAGSPAPMTLASGGQTARPASSGLASGARAAQVELAAASSATGGRPWIVAIVFVLVVIVGAVAVLAWRRRAAAPV